MDAIITRHPNLSESLVECSLTWENILTRLASVCKRRNYGGTIRIFIRKADSFELSHFELRLSLDNKHVEFVRVCSGWECTTKKYRIIKREGEANKERIKRVLYAIIQGELLKYKILSLRFNQS